MDRQRPDDYYNNGFVEMARYGQTISITNQLSEREYENLIENLAIKHDEKLIAINGIVKEIREKVEKSDPENLMNYILSTNYLLLLNKKTERDFSADENFQLRAVEYIQSVLVSCQNNYEKDYDEEQQEQLYEEILSLTTQLYKEIPEYLYFWTGKMLHEKTITKEEVEYIFYMQMMSQTRGEQYQVFRISILRKLLEPQEKLIEKVYGITHDVIINGLEQLEINLSSGRLQAFEKLVEQYEKYREKGENSGQSEENTEIVLNAIGLRLFDVKKATNWPTQLINDLTIDLGEEKSFWEHDQYCGWPLWNLPIQFKPFIRINKISYCFDYYIFFDNVYRSVQKAISAYGEDIATEWNSNQGKSSEELVGDIFSKILPGCRIYRSNYYSIGGHESAENDLLVTYKDVLFIIEVKAGSFTYTSPITDFASHKKSLVALVEKAEQQCIRVKQYIESADDVAFFDGNELSNETVRIKSAQYSQVYMLDVTFADFNELAAQMEKIHIANTLNNIVAISINDLWVYCNYFDSPSAFIHFIKQRTAATKIKELLLSDELDHLGLYIAKNLYAAEMDSFENADVLFFNGFREEIDKFFSLSYIGQKIEKPIQPMPELFKQFFQKCDHDLLENSTKLTNSILDLSFEKRKQLAESVLCIYYRETEMGRMYPLTSFSECSYVVFVKRPGIEELTDSDQKKYVQDELSRKNLKECWWIEIEFNDDINIETLKYELIEKED